MNGSARTWIERLLGFDGSRIPDGAEVQFAWTNLPQSWGVFVLIAVSLVLAWLIVWLYRHEIAVCPPRVRRLLAGLRLLVLLVLLAVFLGPAVTFTERRILQPLIVLLRDDSQSMATADRYLDDTAAGPVARGTAWSVDALRENKPTRADVVERLLERDDRKLLGELERRGRLRVVNFHTEVERLETRPARLADPESEEGPIAGLPPLLAEGRGTDLRRAFADGLADRLTAAIVAFTDGQHTSREAGQETLRAAAEQARERGVPLLLVGVGDPARPRNLQIADVYADPQVWRDDPFEIQALLRATGVGKRTVQVSLVERKPTDLVEESDVEQVLERRDVELPEDGGQLRLVFTHTPTESGRRAYTVRVEPIENELSDDDNEPASPVEVKVLSERARVLLVAGSPTWEYRGVQRLLSREKSVNLSCWLQTIDDGRTQEGDTLINQLPYSREELFKYDALLLFDPDPKEFDTEWIDLVKQFVGEHAGGILYMAGPKFAGRFLAGQRTREMRDILPVRLGDVGAMEVAALLSTNSRAWPLGVVAANVDQPLMRFYPEPAETLSRWESLPGIFWSFPSQEPKPAARVLIEHSDPTLRRVEGSRPLLVTGQYGAGRTVFVGFNGTWRWRRVGKEAEFFNRFWIQTTRYLVEGRSLEGKRRGIVETERFRYELGDRVTVTASLKDATYKPLEADQVTALVTIDDGEPKEVVLRAVTNQPGQFETTLIARRTGRHVVAIESPADAGGRVTIETTFAVSRPSVEVNEVWLDKPLLVELAEASGGRYFELDELDQLAAAIPDRTQNLDLQSKPIPLWDTNRILLLLVGLLSLEWAMRKWFKLL